MKLKARFERAMADSPGVADDAPQGSGPDQPSRHAAAADRPSADQEVAGPRPRGSSRTVNSELLAAQDRWCRRRRRWSSPTEALLALPQTEIEADFHCVTTWSRMDLGLGRRAAEPICWQPPARPRPRQFVLCHAYGRLHDQPADARGAQRRRPHRAHGPGGNRCPTTTAAQFA